MKEPEPLALLSHMTKGAVFGGAWGLLGLVRPSARSEPFSIPLQAAAAGAVAAFFLYCFAELSGRSRGWYYLVWSASVASAVTVVRIPYMVEHDTGMLGLLATALAGAIGGLGFARMAEGFGKE